MTTSTKLILSLTVAVSLVMTLVGVVLLRQRANALEQDALNVVRAHSRTLQIAIDEQQRQNPGVNLQPLIERLVNENQGIASVILYSRDGKIVLAVPPSVTETISDIQATGLVISRKEELRIRRILAGQEMLSLILPETSDRATLGAIEVSVPVTFIQQEVVSERNDIILLGVISCLTIFCVVWLVTRRSIGRYIGSLVDSTDRLGGGQLNHRVDLPPSAGEFHLLAQAFNQMASSLAEQQQLAAGEAQVRLELERKLRHSERLAAVGHLAAGVAHEMGAPLQVIDGRAKQLQEQANAPPEKLQRNLEIIRMQAERITRIVRSLLNLARPIHLHLRRVDLRQQMAQALEALETQAHAAKVVYAHVSEPPVWAQADPDLLQQVLTNLLLNAIQAMPQGGRLQVEYADRPLHEEGQDYVYVRILDSGAGVATADLEHIFDPFYTTKEVGTGTGLGLSISNRIIEEHQGWIEAANWTKGGNESGAVFTCYLLAAPTPEQATVAADPIDLPAQP